MAITDFWQVLDHQKLSGKNILNVYHAKRIKAGADAQEVAEAFAHTVLNSDLLGIQDNNLSRTTVEVENLGEPTDFHSFDSSALGGTDVGDHGPAFNVATIQFNRTRTDMKNGQKRFTAGNENDEVDGVWDAGMLASLALVGTAIHNPWHTAAAPAVDVCAFVIIKRFCVVEDQVPCVKYRLADATEIDAWHYIPTSKIVRSRMRSQVSRKVL